MDAFWKASKLRHKVTGIRQAKGDTGGRVSKSKEIARGEKARSSAFLWSAAGGLVFYSEVWVWVGGQRVGTSHKGGSFFHGASASSPAQTTISNGLLMGLPAPALAPTVHLQQILHLIMVLTCWAALHCLPMPFRIQPRLLHMLMRLSVVCPLFTFPKLLFCSSPLTQWPTRIERPPFLTSPISLASRPVHLLFPLCGKLFSSPASSLFPYLPFRPQLRVGFFRSHWGWNQSEGPHLRACTPLLPWEHTLLCIILPAYVSVTLSPGAARDHICLVSCFIPST